MGIIYKLTSPSGKSYIGQTRRTLQERMNGHKSNGKCRLIHKAIKKYGFVNFTLETLVEVPNNLLNLYEEKMIAAYGTHGKFGYNLSDGGEKNPMFCPKNRMRLSVTLSNPAVRKKISVSLSKRLQTEEGRLQRSEQTKKQWKYGDIPTYRY